MPVDPVRASAAIEAKPERIVAERAPEQRGGRHDGEEHDAEHDRTDEPMQLFAQPHPGAVRPREEARVNQCCEEERGGDGKAPPPNRVTEEERQHPQDGEYAGKDEAEHAI